MNKYAVISCDDNIDYYSLVPITCYSWHKLGYTPIVIQVIDTSKEPNYKNFTQFCGDAIILPISSIEGVRDSTTAQISRLFVSCGLGDYIKDEDIIMTGDADMVMGKDIFTQEADIVSYGFNITGRTEIPICYVKATKSKWKELMKIGDEDIYTEIEKQLTQNAFSEKWEDYWSVDQQILTQNAKEYGLDNILFIDRLGDGDNHGLPLGRWDRYKWDYTPTDIVDVHVIRSPLQNWDKITDMCKHLWPNDDLTWVMKLEKELNK